MKSRICRRVLTGIITAVMAFSQAYAAAPEVDPQTVLATIDDEKITYGTLETFFNKNNYNQPYRHLTSVSRDSVEDFLDLYIKYRLKVKDAERRGLTEDPAILQEIKTNRDAVAGPFLFSKVVEEPKLVQLQKRRSEEVKVQIIMFRAMPGKESIQDRAAAAIEQLNNGADFSALASEVSDDLESKARGGNIKWFSTMMVHRNLEDAIALLNEGDFTKTPVNVDNMLFIVKLIERAPLQWRLPRHLLLKSTAVRDSLATESLADSLYRALQNGADFTELVSKYTDDMTTRGTGGSLSSGYYSRSYGFENNKRPLVPAFEDALFRIGEGEVSKPVHTKYGWHIVRCDSIKTQDSLTIAREVQKRYRELYYEGDQAEYLRDIRETMGYELNSDAFASLLQRVDSLNTSMSPKWDENISDDLRAEVLYVMGEDGEFTVGAFLDSLSAKRELRASRLNSVQLKRAIELLTRPSLMDHLTKNLETEYPEFARLASEFHNGILIFKLEEEEVWSKMAFDSTEAQAWFAEHREEYRTDSTFYFREIYVLEEEKANDIYTLLEDGADFEELASIHTQRQGLRESSGMRKPISTSEHMFVRKYYEHNMKPGDVSKPFKHELGRSIIQFVRVEAPRNMTYAEALPEFATRFQDQKQKRLQDAWIDSIKEHFEVTKNEETLNELW